MPNTKLDGATRDAIESHLFEILRSLVQDSDVAITSEASFEEIGLDSVSVVYLIGEIQQSFGLRDALYKALVKNNEPLLALRVARFAECVCETLGVIPQN